MLDRVLNTPFTLTVNLKFLFDFKLEQLKGEIKLKVKYKLCVYYSLS